MKKTNYSEICKQKLEYLNYSPKTKNLYLFYINQFLTQIDKSATNINSTDFQSYLDNYKFTSVSQQNQVINSISLAVSEILSYRHFFFK